MTEPERAALDHIRKVVDSVIGALSTPDVLPSGINTSILPVPYLSQFGPGAEKFTNDSGSAAGAMLVRAYTHQNITPSGFYDQTGQLEDIPLSFAQISNTMSANGVPAELRNGLRLADIPLILFSGRPAIALIQQVVLQQAGLSPELFLGPHYVVVVGMDVEQVIIHDPLRKDASGQAQGIPWVIFYQAWTRAERHERALLVPRQQLVRRVRVAATSLNVHQQPSSGAEVIDTVNAGELFEITIQKNGWGKIGEERWISLSYTMEL